MGLPLFVLQPHLARVGHACLQMRPSYEWHGPAAALFTGHRTVDILLPARPADCCLRVCAPGSARYHNSSFE